MKSLFEISGLNAYIQIAVTIISVSVHLLSSRNKKRTESIVEIFSIYTFGLAGWFSIMSGFFWPYHLCGSSRCRDRLAPKQRLSDGVGFCRHRDRLNGFRGFLDQVLLAALHHRQIIIHVGCWIDPHIAHDPRKQFLTQQHWHHCLLGFSAANYLNRPLYSVPS